MKPLKTKRKVSIFVYVRFVWAAVRLWWFVRRQTVADINLQDLPWLTREQSILAFVEAYLRESYRCGAAGLQPEEFWEAGFREGARAQYRAAGLYK